MADEPATPKYGAPEHVVGSEEDCPSYLGSDRARALYDGDLGRTLDHLGKELADGVGKLVFGASSAQDVYEGEFKAGLREGRGVMTWKHDASRDGPGPHILKYDGEWLADKMHFSGKCEYDSGATYDGEWYQGVECGKGTFIFRGDSKYEDGTKYVGDWKGGNLDGKGRLYRPGCETMKEEDSLPFLTREGMWKEGEEVEPKPAKVKKKKTNFVEARRTPHRLLSASQQPTTPHVTPACSQLQRDGDNYFMIAKTEKDTARTVAAELGVPPEAIKECNSEIKLLSDRFRKGTWVLLPRWTAAEYVRLANKEADAATNEVAAAQTAPSGPKHQQRRPAEADAEAEADKAEEPEDEWAAATQQAAALEEQRGTLGDEYNAKEAERKEVQASLDAARKRGSKNVAGLQEEVQEYDAELTQMREKKRKIDEAHAEVQGVLQEHDALEAKLAKERAALEAKRAKALGASREVLGGPA